MIDHLYSVIMAGGIGSRLWPRSRAARPKQFLDLIGSRTMLQETVARIEPLIPLERVLIVVGEEHAETVHAQLPDLPMENILVEPGPRGTAPCIGLAAVALRARDPQTTMAVFPADHLISDEAGFRQAIASAAHLAQDGYLVTLGISPSHAHTGYGYIQGGTALGEVGGLPAFEVQRFTEKPDAETASRFLQEGGYYWNGGIFVWQTSTILDEMANLLPPLSAELERLSLVWDSEARAETLSAAWGRVPQTTIDYGVMEKSTRVAVIPIDVGWDDVGNWSTLSQLVPTDQAQNSTHGSGHPLLLDTRNSYVYASPGKLVTTIGLEDMVVIDTPDALLICRKDRAQDVRDVVEQLKAKGWEQYL